MSAWLVRGDEAVLLGADGRTPVAGAGRRPGGFCGWIWVRGALAPTRLVLTDTVPGLEDAMRAADEVLHAARSANAHPRSRGADQ